MTETVVEHGGVLREGRLPLHPRMQRVWAVGYGVLFGALFALMLVPWSAAAGTMALVWVAIPLGALSGWRYAARYAAMYSAHYLSDGVLIRRGVWWRSEVFVPRVRIQHTDVNQGPLDRRWNMASLSLHTAGTAHVKLSLPGLPYPVAVQLRDQLLDRRDAADGA